MTACNSVQDVNLGKKAVSAALAGTLAVGMVPGVALAATADDAAAGEGIEALTATAGDEFKNAQISQVKINGGAAEATPAGKIELVKGATTAIAPVQLKSSITGTVLDLYDADGNLISGITVEYSGKKAADGSPITPSATMPTEAGAYTVTVTGTGAYANLSAKLNFSIVGKSLAGATLFDNADGKESVSNTSFTYDGDQQVPGVALDGAALPTADYTVAYYEADGKTPVTPAGAPKAAGSYIAVVSGATSSDYEGSEAQIPFTVAQLDLSSADIVVNDVVYAASAANTGTVSSINGSTTLASDISSDLDPSYPTVPTKTGSYSMVVKPTVSNANVIGEKTVSYNVVDSTTIYVANADGQLTNGATVPVDLSAGESFATSGIKVYEGANDKGTQLTSGQYTVTVTDASGATVPASSLSTAGKYTVTVAVNSAAMDYTLGGKVSFTVEVTNGDIEASDMFVTYGDKAASSFTKYYTGQNYLDGVAVKVIVGDKTLVEGTDYEVAYTNGKGEAVTEFTNADTYKVTITSKTWNVDTTGSANVCTFTVAPITVDASDLKVAGLVTITKGGTTSVGLPYTGSDITPSFEYATVDADNKPVLDAAGNPVYAALPTDAYTIAGIAGQGNLSGAKAIKAVGAYKVTLADNTDDVNFVINPDQAVDVEVIDAKVFQDVPTDAWYAQVVSEAYKQGYMFGYSGTTLFGPNDSITRAQVACVLYNMAGGDNGTVIGGGNDNYNSALGGYTSFDDVDAHAWYAKAVAWAKDAGVVHGYAGTNDFDPEADVTREQFAAMLWNYAKAVQSPTVKDVDVAAALASKPDGSKVSDWARDAVAWAVQNEIMGNGGVIDPLSSVTRAETAAMAVNFQPESVVTKPVSPVVATVSKLEVNGGNALSLTVGDAAVAIPAAIVTLSDGKTNADYTVALGEVDPAGSITYDSAKGEISATDEGTAVLTYTSKQNGTDGMPKVVKVNVTASN